MTIRQSYLAILTVALAIIAGAWVFEWAGYAPCPLCLKQRWAWYAAIVLAAVCAAAMPANRWGLAVLALVMTASAVFGVYHSGVEWKWWPGPGTCSGMVTGELPDLTNDPVVSCDEAAIRILGLSLAGWNAVFSAALATLAGRVFLGAK